MLRLCHILCLTGLGFAIGDVSFFEFSKGTCNFTYGMPLGQVERINDMQCVKSCVQHGNCMSLMYKKLTRQCFLNAEKPEEDYQFPADCGVKYAQVLGQFGCDEGWQHLADRCYLYVDQLLTWSDCDRYCLKEKSYLAKLYNLSTYPILFNVSQTGWSTATISPSVMPWITVNDQLNDGVFVDRDGVPINPDLSSTMSDMAGTGCGAAHWYHVHLSSCNDYKSCLCEKELRIIPKRSNQLK